MVSNKLEGFPALTFIQLTVTQNAEDTVSPPRQCVRERHTCGDGHALPERTGRGIHAGSAQPVGVARQARAVLIQGFQLANREIAFQRQRGIQRRACMPLGEHEIIAILPVRIFRVDAHHIAVQYCQRFHH